MKKTILMAVLVLCTITASAQKQPFSGNRFFDNWSIGLNVGAVSATHNLGFSPAYGAYQFGDRTVTNPRSFWQRARFIAGLELTKQWTPIFASAIQGWADVNTTPSHTFIDRWGVAYLNKVNLSNLFCGYKGKPRFFELQALAGIGVASHIKPEYKTPFGSNVISQNGGNLHSDDNDLYFVTRFGLSFDFNIGEQRAWTISLKPVIVYNLDQELFQGIRPAKGHTGATFDINDSEIELMAGLTYHFSNSNGKHYFTNVREFDQAELDALNARINALRADVEAKDGEINALSAEADALRKQLQDCLSRPVKVEYRYRDVPVTESHNTRSLTNNVHFRIGKSTIEANQVPNVERVAIYLKKNAQATVDVLGYASKDGDLAANERLAEARAQAVKNMLVKKYGIKADRINAKGCGVSEAYDELEWNRVSECTIVAGE